MVNTPTNLQYVPKFGRSYSMVAQGTTGIFLTVEPPFTLEFDITRNIFSSTNVAQLRVFNLAPNTRNLLRKNVIDLDDQRTVTLKAGYGDNLPVVFAGNITQAWSVREGRTNFITQIESFDGGFAFATGITSRTFQAGASMRSVLEAIIEDLPGVSLGVIGDGYDFSIGSRGNTYSGNSAQLLTELTNGQFYIDNGKAYILGNSECILGQTATISANTGLLGTPLREQSFISIDMVFEPSIVCGQIVDLQSGTDQTFNGEYKVASVKHRGTISPVVCGEAITTLVLDASAQSLTVVNG
jgi:hypothetical protein